ncbi:MAG: hypothetical protein WC849_01950 [Candidatus Paceibacterota bacterium]
MENAESKFASKNLTVGEINAIVKKLGGEENARKFLRDELVVSKPISQQILFGRLKKVISNIYLEPTEHFNTRDFFKTKNDGGIFAYVDNDIFNWFETEIHNSPVKELASYEFTEKITEENIVGDAKTNEIYEEVDFAHIKQVCERHISKGEKLLQENCKSNLFWVRNKKGELCKVSVWLNDDGWYVYVIGFYARSGWGAGGHSFFRN